MGEYPCLMKVLWGPEISNSLSSGSGGKKSPFVVIFMAIESILKRPVALL